MPKVHQCIKNVYYQLYLDHDFVYMSPWYSHTAPPHRYLCSSRPRDTAYEQDARGEYVYVYRLLFTISTRYHVLHRNNVIVSAFPHRYLCSSRPRDTAYEQDARGQHRSRQIVPINQHTKKWIRFMLFVCMHAYRKTSCWFVCVNEQALVYPSNK